MKLKQVIDEFGRVLTIDEETRKVYLFSNKDKVITYSAQVVENGKHIQFFVRYDEVGTIDNIADKVQSFGNVFSAVYASVVNYNQAANDPDRKIWKEMLNKLEEKQDVFFTKNGDWKAKITVSSDKVREYFIEWID